MKLMKAQKEHICSKCSKVIEELELYWGTSYNDYCNKCGDEKKNMKVESKIAKSTLCKCCSEPAVNLIHGAPVCDIHIGEVVKL